MKRLRYFLMLLVISMLFGILSRPMTASAQEFYGTIVLGRPTYSSVTVSITTEAESEVYLSYGAEAGSHTRDTVLKNATAASPAVFTMDGLSTDAVYYYVVRFRPAGTSDFSESEEYSFKTPKTGSTAYNFTIQSDSHLLNKADPALYTQSMQTMASLSPDFMFDLGDAFLMDNGNNDPSSMTQDQVNEIYRQQLPYFSTVTHSSPLFLTIGNHESEYGPMLDGTMDNLAAKSTLGRLTYYPNPVPNEFYTGNTENDPLFGSVQNYYAFTWGDALYVSIDPYRYGLNGASGDNTVQVLRECAKTIEANGVETEVISLAGMRLHDAMDFTGGDDGFDAIIAKIKEADGLITGGPVYWGAVRAQLMTALQRIAMASMQQGNFLSRMVGGPIAIARRGGSTTSLQEMMMFYLSNDMIVPGSTYWNIVFGQAPGQALQDEEGMNAIRRFGENTAFLIQKIKG